MQTYLFVQLWTFILTMGKVQKEEFFGKKETHTIAGRYTIQPNDTLSQIIISYKQTLNFLFSLPLYRAYRCYHLKQNAH